MNRDPGGRTPSHLRDLNSRAMLQVLRQQGPTARIHVAQALKLSKATVTLTARDLLDAGLIRELGEDPTQPRATGRQPQLLDVNPQAASLLGIDIGAQRTTVARADLLGNVTAQRGGPTARQEPAELVARLHALLDEVLDASGGAAPGAVVVGVPGMVSPEGVIDDAVNVPSLRGLDLRRELADRLAVPVRLENDINLAATGEQSLGGAKGFRNFAFVSLGTGVGAGLYIDGQLLRGTHGFAGELGDMLLTETAGPSLGLEALVSAPALGQQGLAAGLPDRRPETLFEAALAGHPEAQGVLQRAALLLAKALLNIHLLLDLEAIVLGGALGAYFDVWAEPVRTTLAARHPRPPLVLPSALPQPALAGALSLAVQDCWEALCQDLLARRTTSSA